MDLDLSSPSEEDELRRLVRALKLARGFRVYIARTAPGEDRKRLMAEVTAQFGGAVETIEFITPVDHLRQAISERISGPSSTVFVAGLESWIPAGAAGEQTPFVQNLNASRDLFSQIVDRPLVLWISDYVMRSIQRGAPDFFSVISGLYLFAQPEAELALSHTTGELGLSYIAESLQRLNELDERLEAINGNSSPLLSSYERVNALNQKVVTLIALGRAQAAESLADQTFAEACVILGPEHPDTLISASNLAYLYQTIGRYPEAEKLHRETLEISRRILGPEHPNTLASSNNLAYLYARVKMYSEAETLYQDTLEISRRILGSDHPNTLSSTNNLASLYQNMRRYAEAEALYRETFEVIRRTLGSDHPNTLCCANNLAFFYQSVGRYAEAEPLYRETLEISYDVLGAKHPDTLNVANNLAGLFHRTGRYQEARELNESALESACELPQGHLIRQAIERTYSICRDIV